MTKTPMLDSPRLAGETHTPNVSLIVLNWNGWRDTLECLSSLVSQTYADWQIILVDNGSTNDSTDQIVHWADARWKRQIHMEDGIQWAITDSKVLVLIRNDENLGYAGGNNVGIHCALKHFASDYAFLLNNDAQVDPDCLTNLIQAACKANAGIAGALIKGTHIDYRARAPLKWHLFISHQLYHRLAGLIRPRPVMAEDNIWATPEVNGTAMLIRRDALESVHSRTGRYLKPELFVYWEDSEFCYQADCLGYAIIATGNAFVRHKFEQSSGLVRFYYYMTRNRALLARDILNPILRAIFYLLYLPWCAALACQWSLKGREKIAQAILCGVLDGIRGIGGKWKGHDLVTKNPETRGKTPAGQIARSP